MGQVLHGCATTTEAVRRAIQQGLSRCETSNAKGLRVVSPQAKAARQVSIAAARKPRRVDADVK
jgi:hypothetical protein